MSAGGDAPDPNEQLWYTMFAIGHPLLRKYQSFNRRLPAPPRCKLCLAPFRGPGSIIMAFQGRRPSSRNPRYCSRCDHFLRTFPGGAEVDMSFVFIDVRGSVELGARMTPRAFSRAMGAFYSAATRVFSETDGFIIDLVGDEVVALYPPGFSGPDHARKAMEAARQLLDVVVTAPDGTIVPFGIAVNTGLAYIGTVTGAAAGLEDVRALGDNVNVTARLAAEAGAGEALVTQACLAAAAADPSKYEMRSFALKGRVKPIVAHILRGNG